MQSNLQPVDDRRRLALGLILLIVGAIALVEQAIQFDVPDAAWPVAIIVPGITLLVVGLIVRHEAGVGLIVAGSIVTTVGLVLLYQNATGRWESWAYAWALVGPVSSTLIERAARGVEAYAERDTFDDLRGGLEARLRAA